MHNKKIKTFYKITNNIKNNKINLHKYFLNNTFLFKNNKTLYNEQKLYFIIN